MESSDYKARLARLSPEKLRLLSERVSTNLGLRKVKSADGPYSLEQILSDDHTVCWDIGTPGSLDSLRPYAIPHPPLLPHQIRIKVASLGLNFRDLMIALGLYPPTPGMPSNLGTDYSGVVVERASNVREFEVGDSVLALSARHLDPRDHFPSHVRAFTVETAKKPEKISFEEAAALPTAFVTAHYALSKLVRLSAGERVLIHCASGGVGLAAVTLAKALGAEVLGTAGTEPKRDFLKPLLAFQR